MNDDLQARRIRQSFDRHFGGPSLLVRSPGRVNLIGEHTDCHLGLVLPAAVDRAIWLALRPREDGQVRLFAEDFGRAFEKTTLNRQRCEEPWADYLMGIYAEMAADGRHPGGVDCAFGGDVPIGSGMSSSAALECGFAFGLNELFGTGYDRLGLARLGQRAENHFVGVNCGIMDQFASVLGREGHLIRLDCRDLGYAYVPFLDPGLLIVLCDTQVHRSLAAGGEYNARRAQCEVGTAYLKGRYPRLESLRDATPAMLEAHREDLGQTVFKRCAYVLKENQRVLDACSALAETDFERFGRCMNESHEGLRFGYEVSCPELDLLADGARGLPGVLGSRMMGAGFGGCTINLVREAELPGFLTEMAWIYRRSLGKEPLIHVCRLTDGTQVVA